MGDPSGGLKTVVITLILLVILSSFVSVGKSASAARSSTSPPPLTKLANDSANTNSTQSPATSASKTFNQTVLNLINGVYVSKNIIYYSCVSQDFNPVCLPNNTEPFPAIYSNTGPYAFWSSPQPVMVTAPLTNYSFHDAGLMTFPGYFMGEVTMRSIGVFDGSFAGDGFEAYLFLSPPAGANSSDVYLEYANFYSPQGDVLFPYSTTPYVVVQWDPQHGGDFNNYIVENPNTTSGTFNTSNIVAAGQTRSISLAAPSPGDYLILTTIYSVTNNSVTMTITDLNNSQVDYQETLNLSNFGFQPPSEGTMYSFGAGASGNSQAGWGYIYIGLNTASASYSTYKVIFTETGLPPGTPWYVNLSNGQSYSSSTSSITFYLPNGTYQYTIGGVSGYTAQPSSGSFTVSGAPVSVAITFLANVFQVIFTETGLPPGTPWYVNLSNGESQASTNNTITFYLPNGNYTYSVGTRNTNYGPSMPSASFTIDNSGLIIPILFIRTTFQVTFTEIGLPSGTEWDVNLGNGLTYSSSTNTITFYLPDGLYKYTITTIMNDYAASPSSGSFTVFNGPVNLTVKFIGGYVVEFPVYYQGSTYYIRFDTTPSLIEAVTGSNTPPTTEAVTGSNTPPTTLGLPYVARFLTDLIQSPQMYTIAGLSVLSSVSGWYPITNKTLEEDIITDTLLWALAYSFEYQYTDSYGSTSTSYNDLQTLQSAQWISDLGIYAAKIVNYLTIIGPLINAIYSYFNGASRYATLAEQFVDLVYNLIKGYNSLQSEYGSNIAQDIINTLYNFGLISSNNLGQYSPDQLLVKLAQSNPSELKNLVDSLMSDLGYSSIPEPVTSFDQQVLENLGQNIYDSIFSASLSAATSSAITFCLAYFTGPELTFSTAGQIATSKALESLSESLSNTLTFLLPLDIASVIDSFYLEPMSQDLVLQGEIQNLLASTFYPDMQTYLSLLSSNQVANVSDGAGIVYDGGAIDVLWYQWFNASMAELRGEFLNSNANSQISEMKVINNAIFNFLQYLANTTMTTGEIASSLVNGMEPEYAPISPDNVGELPYFQFEPSTIVSVENHVWDSINSAASSIESAVSSGVSIASSAFSAGISKASSVASSALSWLESKMNALKFNLDPPAVNVTLDGFWFDAGPSTFMTSDPFASFIVSNDSLVLVVPGNITGTMTVESNESVNFQFETYQPSSLSSIESVFNATLGADTAYLYGVEATNTSEVISFGSYQISITESGLNNHIWGVVLTNPAGTFNITLYSSGGSLNISGLVNGVYDLRFLAPQGYTPSPSATTVTLDGASAHISEKFEEDYQVTFTETGLPSGTMWYVNLSNGQSISSTSGNITIYLPNGTYSYTVGSSAEGYAAPSGSLTVNGGSVAVSIRFEKTSALNQEYLVLGVLAVIIVAVAVILVLRRKR